MRPPPAPAGLMVCFFGRTPALREGLEHGRMVSSVLDYVVLAAVAIFTTGSIGCALALTIGGIRPLLAEASGPRTLFCVTFTTTAPAWLRRSSWCLRPGVRPERSGAAAPVPVAHRRGPQAARSAARYG